MNIIYNNKQLGTINNCQENDIVVINDIAYRVTKISKQKQATVTKLPISMVYNKHVKPSSMVQKEQILCPFCYSDMTTYSMFTNKNRTVECHICGATANVKQLPITKHFRITPVQSPKVHICPQTNKKNDKKKSKKK